MWRGEELLKKFLMLGKERRGGAEKEDLGKEGSEERRFYGVGVSLTMHISGKAGTIRGLGM